MIRLSLISHARFSAFSREFLLKNIYKIYIRRPLLMYYIPNKRYCRKSREIIINMLCSTAFISIAISSVLLYFYVKHLYTYWLRHGMSQLRPTFPFRNFGQSIKQQVTAIDLLDKLYHSITEPFMGVYSFFWPILIARDPEFIRNILIWDFSHFVDRGCTTYTVR